MKLEKEAKELVEKFALGGWGKHNALKCINVVISSGLILIDYRDYSGDKRSCLNYWQEMKIEINKL